MCKNGQDGTGFTKRALLSCQLEAACCSCTNRMRNCSVIRGDGKLSLGSS